MESDRWRKLDSEREKGKGKEREIQNAFSFSRFYEK